MFDVHLFITYFIVQHNMAHNFKNVNFMRHEFNAVFGSMHQLENISKILQLLWEMVSLHTILLICVLHNDTCQEFGMCNVEWLIDEWRKILKEIYLL